jgi:hypothetical protein
MRRGSGKMTRRLRKTTGGLRYSPTRIGGKIKGPREGSVLI